MLKWGWGVNSLEDIMCADVTANTLISLNDWMVGRQWRASSEARPEIYKGADLYDLYASTANMYPTLLVGMLDEDMRNTRAGSFFPLRHTRTQLVPGMGIRTHTLKEYPSFYQRKATPSTHP